MSTVEHTGTADLQGDIIGDQKRAEQVAAARRRKAAVQNFVIRMVSLAIFLSLWQVAAINVDPVLFTTPWKVAVAAVDMLRTGELWNSLWPRGTGPCPVGRRLPTNTTQPSERLRRELRRWSGLWSACSAPTSCVWARLR